jgi:hypothetical protein
MRFVRLLSVVLPLGIAAVATAPTSSAEAQPPCKWEVEYTLAANLKLTDTPMGEGNGVYGIGPGKVVLRYDEAPGRPGGVQMLEYKMREYFTIHSKTLFWTTTVVTDTRTSAMPDACSIAADGTLDNRRVLRWRTPIRGYHTDGTLTCTGSLCGKFGAPPEGQSPFHVAPHAVGFKPFVFGPDMTTFTMETTHVSQTTMPKQSAEIALSAREVRRACVPVVACPAP